jgi:hypothetical protein
VSGDLFSSRQAAIDDAKKSMRAKWGAEITFPDGNDGMLVHNTMGYTAAWGFRVANPVGKVVARFVVFSGDKDFAWQEHQAPAS